MKNFTYPLLILALILSGTSIIHAQYITVTIAGSGTAGYSGDGGPARQAKLKTPTDVCLDAANNIYFLDAGNQLIRKVSPKGIITTIAGGGTSTADNIPATNASITGLTKMAIDAAGNIYVSTSHKVRMISSSGIITTVAGTGSAGYNGDGIAATSSQLNGPVGVCVDAAGTIYILDVGNNRIRKVNATTGIISTYVTGLTVDYESVCVDAAGNVYFANSNTIEKAAAVTGIVTTVCNAYEITSICIDGAGNNIYFTQSSCGCVKLNLATGTRDLIANNGVDGYNGDGGNSLVMQLNVPSGICIDAVGNLYVADKANNRIRKIAKLTNAPSYIYGKSQTINICPGGVVAINDWLAVTDVDTLQNEIWTVLTLPVSGVLSGFTATNLSGGRSGLSSPSGTVYTSPSSYVGMDSFQVRVTDGTFSDTTTIFLNIYYGALPDAGYILNHLGGVGGDTVMSDTSTTLYTVCKGHSIHLHDAVTGGVWSVDNGNASISASGVLNGISLGMVTVTYTVTNTCSSNYVTKQVQVLNCSTAGVTQAITDEIRIFPNPVSSVLNIEWNNLKAQHADVVIADVTGRVVMVSELQNNTGSGTTQLNLSNLNDGVYILNINGDEVHYTGKIVVSKK